MAGHAYKAAVDELDIGVGRDMDAPYRATVLEPIGKLNNYYSTINAAIDKRNHKVGAGPCRAPSHRGYGSTIDQPLICGSDAGLRCVAGEGEEAGREAFRRYYKATSGTFDTNPSKISSMLHWADVDYETSQAQAEHDEARDIFNILNEQLISELPMLMDLRIRMLFSYGLKRLLTVHSLP